MDGASNCKTAMDLISELFPAIFSQRCAVHGWSLILSDIVKLVLKGASVYVDDIKAVLLVVAFAMNHSSVHDMLKTMEVLALMKPAQTRMASTFFAVVRFLEDSPALQRLVVSPEVVAELNRVGQTAKFKDALQVAKNTVMDGELIERLAQFVRICEPAVQALRALDSKRETMGEAAYAYYRVEEEWNKVDDMELRDALLSIRRARKKDVVTPLAVVAGGLSVYSMYGDQNSDEIPIYRKGCKRWQVPGFRPALEVLVKKYFSDHPDGESVIGDVMSSWQQLPTAITPTPALSGRATLRAATAPSGCACMSMRGRSWLGSLRCIWFVHAWRSPNVESENKKVANLLHPHRNKLKPITLQRLRTVANAQEVDYTPQEAWAIRSVIEQVQQDARVSMMSLMLNR